MAEGFRIASAYVEIAPDTEGFREKAQEQLDEAAAGLRADASLGLDASELDASLDEARAKLDEFGDEAARVRLGVDKEQFSADLDEAKEKLDEFDGSIAEAELLLNKDEFDAEADDAEARIASLDGERAEPHLGLDDSGFKTKLDEDKAELASASSQSSGFSMPGGMLTYLGTGLAALTPGFAGAATGLGLLGGTGALAFGGITQALSAAHQSAMNVGMTSQQMAAQQFANAVAVQQAQQTIVQSLQQVNQAQQGVEESDYSLSEAQYNLSQSWEQAREQITQLNDALADSKLNVQQASLAVQQAEYQQTLTDQNAMATSLDRQQAALSVAEAQQKLKDAQDQETNATVAANQANQQGIAGSQIVIQAKQAVTQATYGQQDAQQAYQNSVLGVSLAEQNLSNTIKEQQLQWAATQSSENQAANQFALDMSRLTPAGQAFVNTILGLEPAFKGLEGAAQNSVLPGMTVWLNGVVKLLPTVQSGITAIGGAISAAFGQFGELMTTPGFTKVLQGLIDNGIKFADIVLPAWAQFIQELAIAGSKSDAVTGLSNLLAGLANGLSNMVAALTPYEGALSSIFSTLGSALADLGGPLGQVLGSLASALAPALQALLPGFQVLVDALGTGLANALRGAGPLLTVLAQVFSGLMVALAPLLPQIGALIGQLAISLVPMVKALEPAIIAVGQAITAQGTPNLQALATALTEVLPPLTKLIIAVAPLITQAVEASAAIAGWSGYLEGRLIVALGKAAAAVQVTVGAWKAGWADLEHASLFLWHNVMDPMWQGIELGERNFVSAFQKTWNTLEGIFKTPVNFLIGTVYDKGIATLWNDVVGAVGLGSLKLPVIPTLATGGIVPGQDHGYDSKLVMMRPGEGVLVPEAVQAIGPGTVHALNEQYGSGSAGQTGGGLPRFGGGGILGDIGGFFTSLGQTIISGAEFTKELATNPVAAITGLLDKAISTGAKGDLGQIMTAIPKTLVGDLAQLIGLGSGGGGTVGPPTRPSGTVSSWFEQAIAATAVPQSWLPDLETIGWYESSDNPSAINLSDSNAAAGDPSRGIMQTIMSTFLANHQPGTSFNIYDPVANIAAAIRYIRGRYGTPGNTPGIISLAHGGRYEGYDSGGWLLPGSVPVNRTGQPEAVLTPEESAAFVAIARQLTSQGAGATAATRPPAIFQYFGTQHPTAEQRAMQMRDLTLAMSGATP